ncbi:MAG TPA: hypothetical protein ENH59_05440 [Bacteroidetes bacterium]|nr:hypothetical protein [Bacteroidota bacterium]
MRNLLLLFSVIIITFLTKAEKPAGKVCFDLPHTCPAVHNVQDTSILNQLYYNGRIWTGKYFSVYGTEFLMEDKWYRADIVINGIHFNDVALKYDIYNDEILANYYNKRIIILNNENIESFILNIKGKDLYFKNIKNINSLNGHYQVIYEGKSKLYKKWKKKRAQFVVEARYDEFQNDHSLIVLRGEELYELKRRKSFLKTMNDKKAEIRSFIRRENIRLDFDNPESLVPVLEYYDSL